MSDLEEAGRLLRPVLDSLEASRERIDDLNVYPVPDGDTGTNLTLTVRAVADALDGMAAPDRATLARELARAALMGARGNSGVILSQIARGAAEALEGPGPVDAQLLARALRSASDAAYRAVRKPVEGTMLTVIREAAGEAEARAAPGVPQAELLAAVLRRAEDALARTPDQLPVLREAGVVDAGGAGLVEILRGLHAGVADVPLPRVPRAERLGFEAAHQELSRYRYCTSFVVEGDGLDAGALERELELLGDSLLVVGDPTALKVHVHTDDPGRALSAGVAAGAIDAVEIANMHRQTVAREHRLLELVPDLPGDVPTTDVVAVVAGAGNRRLFEGLGAATAIEGGATMNPATAEILAAIEACAAPEVVVLPNNPNVVLAAEQAAGLAARPVRVIPTRSIQAGLAALVAYDASLPLDRNVEEMAGAAAAVATGAVTIASRDVALNGVEVRRGEYLGLLEGEPVAGGGAFEEVAEAVAERLLAEPRGLLTLLTGEERPRLDGLLERLTARHPEVELDVQAGGQPRYPLLLAAE